MESIRKIFAFNLRNLRGDRTQSQVAEATGISFREYQRMEAGTIPRTEEYIAALARFHRVPAGKLFLDPDLPEYKPAPPSIAALAAEVDRQAAEITRLKREQGQSPPAALTGFKRELFDLIAGLDEPQAASLLRILRRTFEILREDDQGDLSQFELLRKKSRG